MPSLVQSSSTERNTLLNKGFHQNSAASSDAALFFFPILEYNRWYMRTNTGNALAGFIVIIIGGLIAGVFLWNRIHPTPAKELISSKLFLEDDAGEAGILQADVEVQAIRATLGHIEADNIATQ